MFDRFFQEIDRGWRGSRATKIPLRLIGSAALMLQADYRRGTKDGDVWQTASITDEIKASLIAMAGKGTSLHKRHGIYIDVVANGLPFLPSPPRWHAQGELNATLTTFEVEVLDVVDVVVSKLKRFHANDQSDVKAMIDLDRVPHAQLVERFRTAMDVFTGDARAGQLRGYIANLNRVERDMLGVDETEIELPDWI